MNYWIFSVTNKKEGEKIYTGREVYEQRMEDAFWGLSERTPNKNKSPRVLRTLGGDFITKEISNAKIQTTAARRRYGWRGYL